MFFKKMNYFNDLMTYLELLKSTAHESKSSLKSDINYLKQVLNEKSATDHSCILSLEKLQDKYDYLEKYCDIAIKYYEDK